MPVLLLVDDEPRIARSLEFALRGSDFQLESLTDPELVEKHIEASRPDLILLDISLVPGSGLDVCRRLKSDDRFKSIPVVLLSGQSDPQTKAAGFEAGANDFIPKPFVTTELLARIRAWLSREP